MDMPFSGRKSAFFQAPIKLAHPFPAPELRAENFTDTRIFLTFGRSSYYGGVVLLHVKGWGSKKFLSLETQGKQTFWRDMPGFWLGCPGGA